MKFNLNHDPNNKTLAIPRAALQLSGLAGVSDLILHTDSGCILLLPGDPTVAELLKTISLISAVAPQLISRLAERSQMAMEAGMTETACGACEHEPHCSGLEIPPCQLAEAGISPNAALESFVEDGKVIVQAAEKTAADVLIDELDDDVRTMLEDSGVQLEGVCRLLEKEDKDATDLICQQAESYAYLIRRLTPLECERLQGFPDGWTDIPGASDSARYKALGNSLAIPCVEFIMSRIAAAMRAAYRRTQEQPSSSSDEVMQAEREFFPLSIGYRGDMAFQNAEVIDVPKFLAGEIVSHKELTSSELWGLLFERTEAEMAAYKLLGEAANADDAETYMERFQSLSEGMEELKRRKASILQIRQEQDAVSRRLQASAAALDAVSAQITEWDENTVYQLLEKVTVMEGFKIRVTFRNGQDIEQSIDQPKRRKRI